jgi:hypothetical protein
MLEALKTQIGGDHYSSMKIQPAEFILANDIGPYEAKAIEYIVRWKKKGGISSLAKAQHAIQILIDYQQKNDTLLIDSEHQQAVNAAQKAEQEAKHNAASKQAEREPLRA